jgi:hypothetical protein
MNDFLHPFVIIAAWANCYIWGKWDKWNMNLDWPKRYFRRRNRDMKRKAHQPPIESSSDKDESCSSSSDEEDQEFERTVSKYLRTDRVEAVPLTKKVLSERPVARSSLSCLLYGRDEIIVFGGESHLCKSSKRTKKGDSSRLYHSDLFSYNLLTKSWSRYDAQDDDGSEGPGPRSAHQMAIAPHTQHRVYLFGGEYGSRQDTKFMQYRDLWCLDLAESSKWTWTRIQPPKRTSPVPNARSGHRLLGLRHFLVLFGGYVDSGRGDLKYLNDLWLFDLKTTEWQAVPLALGSEAPPARSGCVFLKVKGGGDANGDANGDDSDNEGDGGNGQKFFLYGGFNGQQPLSDAWHLSLTLTEGEGWRARWALLRGLSTSPLLRPPKSGIAGATLPDGRICLVGGVSDEAVTNEAIVGTTCHGDLTILEGGKVIDVGKGALCPRFNASCVFASSSDRLVVLGGLMEAGDLEIILDDIVAIDVRSMHIDTLQPNSSAIPLNDDPISSSSSSESDEEAEAEAENEEDEEAKGPPRIKRNQTLRDYFSHHYQYWLSIECSAEAMDEKERRRLAFEACRAHFDSVHL